MNGMKENLGNSRVMWIRFVFGFLPFSSTFLPIFYVMLVSVYYKSSAATQQLPISSEVGKDQ